MVREIFAPWAQIVPGVGPMTAADLLKMGDANRGYELIDGVLVKMPPTGFLHGKPLIRLSAALFAHVDAHHLGEVTPAEEGFVLSQTGQPDTVLAPDLGFVRAERLPLPGAPGSEGFLRLAPDLAVGVVSPNQYRPEIAEKAKLYLRSGVRLVWVVWPDSKTVDVWRPGDADAPGRTLAIGDALDGLDVVPGFAYPLSDLFA